MNDPLLKAIPAFNQIVTLNMPSSRNGRRFALVSTLLSEMKIHHYAVFPILRHLKLKGLEAAAARSPYCHLRWRKPAKPDVLITDQGEINQHGKTIKISYDFLGYLKSSPIPDALFLPILFHPSLLNKANYEHAYQLSNTTARCIGVLFAGNCNPKTYDNDRIRTRYGLANRYELFEHVKKLPSELVFIPPSKEAFDLALASGSLIEKLVWIDTERFKIPQNEWLGLLAKAKYFFSTPGVHYPYCQNLNEAAACGAVPFLQYPDLYEPALKHDVNCILFNEKAVIEKALRSILSKNDPNWKKLSTGVVDWHEKHLSLNHACGEISSFMRDHGRQELNWILAGK